MLTEFQHNIRAKSKGAPGCIKEAVSHILSPDVDT